MRYLSFILSTIAISLVLTIPKNSFAVIEIDITRGNADPLPVALPALPGINEEDSTRGDAISSVIAADLERSGLFRSIPREAFLQDIQSNIEKKKGSFKFSREESKKTRED